MQDDAADGTCTFILKEESMDDLLAEGLQNYHCSSRCNPIAAVNMCESNATRQVQDQYPTFHTFNAINLNSSFQASSSSSPSPPTPISAQTPYFPNSINLSIHQQHQQQWLLNAETKNNHNVSKSSS